MMMKREEAMYKIRQATDPLSYKQQMIEAERSFLEQTLYDREIYDPAKHGNLLEYLAKEQFGEPPIINKGGR
jgi:hypothetical protein